MSDQSALNSAGAAAPATAPAFSSLDVNDQLADLNARLTALENAPAVSAAPVSDVYKSAIARCLQRIFGETLED